ncbi:MAG TPA: response regulator [Desulfobacteraceae bacterium]|mgnify:CR=1 FL=1|nr:response regulator [Desulfobacteraceae bacterium]HPJ67319.1 response regulator [Desulfobacteraceae bacterium]HPQ28200.1 response regulator [Desulfobacteraceae bacterium]
MAKTILIIDDDPDFTESTRGVLESQGYQVISAPKGAEGFSKAQNESPDGILLDVMIENDSAGLETAKKLRDDPSVSKIPVIILTGIRGADQLLASYAPGEAWPNVKDALEKPVDPDLLLKLLEKAVG